MVLVQNLAREATVGGIVVRVSHSHTGADKALSLISFKAEGADGLLQFQLEREVFGFYKLTEPDVAVGYPMYIMSRFPSWYNSWPNMPTTDDQIPRAFDIIDYCWKRLALDLITPTSSHYNDLMAVIERSRAEPPDGAYLVPPHRSWRRRRK